MKSGVRVCVAKLTYIINTTHTGCVLTLYLYAHTIYMDKHSKGVFIIAAGFNLIDFIKFISRIQG